jgi:hypothetical protein
MALLFQICLKSEQIKRKQNEILFEYSAQFHYSLELMMKINQELSDSGFEPIITQFYRFNQ